jgi:hypothetical protein
MTSSRREFIRQIGILLASLSVAHCVPLSRQGGTSHARLRRCWLSLDLLERQAQKDFERGEKTGEQLQADHRAALDDLVAAGKLDPAVAEQVQSMDYSRRGNLAEVPGTKAKEKESL